MSFWGQKKNCQGQNHSFWPFPPISQKSKIHHHSCRFVVFKVHIGEPWAPSSLTRFHQNITTLETCSIYQLGCSQCIQQVIKTRLLSIFKRLRLSIKLNIHTIAIACHFHRSIHFFHCRRLHNQLQRPFVDQLWRRRCSDDGLPQWQRGSWNRNLLLCLWARPWHGLEITGGSFFSEEK